MNGKMKSSTKDGDIEPGGTRIVVGYVVFMAEAQRQLQRFNTFYGDKSYPTNL